MENKGLEIFKLTVKTSDKASENYIIDGQFNRVAKSFGDESNFDLPKGLYSVKIKVGNEILEKPVMLMEDQEISFDPVFFNTAAPLQNTYDTSEIQIKAACEYSRKGSSDVANLGSGSKLFLFGSVGAGVQALDKPDITLDPATGLTLRDYNDLELIDFGRPEIGYYTFEGDPWAACYIDIDPGIYTLCLETGSGARYKQTIVTSPGWQTQIFLQPKNYGIKEKDVRADIVNSSIFMSRIGIGFDPAHMVNSLDGIDYRFTEQLKQALGNKRNVVSKDLLQTLFAEKYENPMLCIFAAHLLLLNKDFVFAELLTVVDKLRALLGSNHPDVEALAVKMGIPTTHIFNAFPMLATSWGYVMEASFSRPELVPKSSVAYALAGHFWDCGPWLVWGKEGQFVNNTVIYYPFAGTSNEEKLQEFCQSYGVPKEKAEEMVNLSQPPEGGNADLNFDIQSSLETNDDPEKGRWGGLAESNNRKLSATVEPAGQPGFYKVVLMVESTDKKSPLTGDIKFHLHPTFLNPRPIVPCENGKAVLTLSEVWGSFTVGVEADEGKTKLELDLAELDGVTEEFKNR
jgi:hypothetical protein